MRTETKDYYAGGNPLLYDKRSVCKLEENIKGSIEVGKLADFTVFSEDILHINPMDIVNVKVDYTIIDGEICYER